MPRSMRWIFCLLLAAAGLLAPPAVRPAFAQPAATGPAATRPSDDEPPAEVEDFWPDPSQPAVLTTAADVRALSPEQAAAGRPVRIRGRITFLSMVPPLMFVQDDTGGVCVSGPRDRELRKLLLYGATVVVEGVTASGGEVAVVTSPGRDPVKIEVLSQGRPPFPRSVTLAQLATPALHGEQVEVEGGVRSVRVESLGFPGLSAAVLTLARGPARVEAVMIGPRAESLASGQWVGATVRARGVFNAAAPDGQNLTTMRLLLRTPRDLVVRSPATAAAELPVTPIRALDVSSATQPAATRTRVAGVVTLALPGRGMFVQDESGGVWVEGLAAPAPRGNEPKQPWALTPGDVVDVVGFAGRRRWSGVLVDATWTVTGKASLPDAPLVTPERALAPGMDARLVRVEAMVLSVSRLSEHTTLVLQSGARVFLARLADPAAGPPPSVGEGSWVRVSGVCVQSPLADDWATGPTAAVASAGGAGQPPPGAARPPSFHLLIPSARAVTVIRGPGWWTPQRLLVVFGILATVALVAFTWVVALRRRVTRQTRLIREHVAKRALYEERVRIARDLHDSLEQDLLGITLQLNATEKLLAQPDRARQSLHLAAAMVRRSQAETHRAVWDLRERRPGQDGLVSAIREAVAGLAAPHAGGTDGNGAPPTPRVSVEVVGEPRELPPQVENHVHRVALEAVTNALKHAGATRVDVELAFAADDVRLKVSDDGRGFDAERLPPPSSGHFGLFGMRERAEKLGAALSIVSRPGGGGTEIRLDVPIGGASANAPATASAPEAVPQ